RDGEKFFAKGRDQVNYELVQQQMKRAGTWRLNLRAQVMRDLARLGRYPQSFNRNPNLPYFEKAQFASSGPMNMPMSTSAPGFGGFGGGVGGFGGGGFGGGGFRGPGFPGGGGGGAYPGFSPDGRTMLGVTDGMDLGDSSGIYEGREEKALEGGEVDLRLKEVKDAEEGGVKKAEDPFGAHPPGPGT